MKIKSKLTSLLLVFSTLLTSINLPPLTTTTYAAETHTAAGAGNVVVGGQTDPKIQPGEEDSSNKMLQNYVPQIDVMKVSLILVNEGSPNAGMPVNNTMTGFEKIKQNPIFMSPESSPGVSTIALSTQEQMFSPANIDGSRRTKGLTLFNSRRELTGEQVGGGTSTVMSYAATWAPYNPAKPENGGHYVATSSDNMFSSARMSNALYSDPGVPGMVGGNPIKAYYQNNPPAGLVIPSGLSNGEWFKRYVQASFVDPINPTGEAKQVFVYHMIANMLKLPPDQYYSEDVENIYKLLADGKAKLLVEPMIAFKTEGCPALQKMFGTVPYICLDAGTLGCCDDVFSVMHFGATSYKTIDNYVHLLDSNGHETSTPNPYYRTGFNRITHGSASEIVWNLYNSAMLAETDHKVNLFSPYDTTYFQEFFNGSHGSSITSASYPKHTTLLPGGLQTGHAGGLVESIFYNQAEENYNNNTGSYSGTNSLRCKTDTYGLVNCGGQMIVPITYSSINYTITAKGYGEPTYKTTSTGQKLPVYKEAFDAVTNQIIVNVQTRLKMDSEITDPAQPKGTRWIDEILAEQPESYNDPNELPVYDSVIDDVRQIRPITSETLL